MNNKFLASVTQIIAENGEDILDDPQWLKSSIADLVKDEPKAERLIFGRCIEYGAYTELKNADPADRAAVKKYLERKLHNEEGLDTALIAGALDVLEAAVWGVPDPQIICRNCEKELQAEWNVCPYCGTHVAPALPPAPAPDESPVPEGFVLVDGGTFHMGSANGDKEERPVHTVTVRSFYMSIYEVTQKEYEAVMGINPSRFKGPDLPVESVSWYDVVDYCNKRSIKEGLTPAYRGSGNAVTCNFRADGYRLPTEAEWEYAAKGGGKDPLEYTYAGSNSADAVAWYNDNSGGSTHPVGTKLGNSLGLYDMSGNVWEWCWDWYGSYKSGYITNPAGAASGSDRVARGGSWGIKVQNVRSAARDFDTPSNQSSYLGFRVVRR
ncbi:MAG: SUMF1/EgtB/PvdO family nonheme iron enzyme [Treponema sp.]|jgi:formylglycine-generating enzyme required for sulfatase activity|nr:SUMF1/EgtB/PvdO family nonheme iron enzyme [Treponema sp.]